MKHERLDGLLFEVMRLVGMRSEWPFGDLTLSLSECMLLFTLAEHGELAQQDLAAAIRVDKSRASRLGSTMEDRGWIERVRDPANRRTYRVRLTAAGRRVSGQVGAIMHARHAAVFDAMTGDERTALAVGLRGLARALREHPFA